MNTIEGFRQLSQQNVEATMRGYAELNKGMNAIGLVMVDFVRRTIAQNTQMLERMVTAGSVVQALEIQSEHARFLYEDYMGEASRIGNIYAEMTRDSLRPYERLVHGLHGVS